ncbi:hypothetical protein A2G94_00920 [Francisella endosymbiont of Ornithodoros moubata]|nr:hypothetical protein A2G94_00920 [Francisella endosymbiont of Ornithodoros moubata]
MLYQHGLVQISQTQMIFCKTLMQRKPSNKQLKMLLLIWFKGFKLQYRQQLILQILLIIQKLLYRFAIAQQVNKNIQLIRTLVILAPNSNINS